MSCADIPYDTLFAMVYTVVDDWYQESGWRLVRSRPGVKPRFSDSEVLTLEVVRELEGETRERRWYARVAANWQALFPCLPERSVLHKRTKSLGLLLDRCRCAVRDRLVDPADPRRLLDGTPVPVCAVSRVGRPDGTSAGRQWQPYGAEIGRCAARAWWFYGFKLVLTATVDLLPDQAVLVPAAADEREAAAALLAPGLVVIGDRNFSRFASPTWRATLERIGRMFSVRLSGAGASATAPAIVARAPIVPPSPAPLIPSGLYGDGCSWCAMAMDGTHSACGSA